MKIAILMANTDESDFAQTRQKDGVKWEKLLAPLRSDWEFVVYSVKDDVFPDTLQGIDGLIVTGSPASVHDSDPWIGRLLSLLREAVEAKTPMFGACFGHQAITVALGGSVGQNPNGWELGVTETAVSTGLPWAEEVFSSIKLNAAHIEQVTELPEGAKTYKGCASCPVGGYFIGQRVFTTQYHPEITPEFMSDLVEELANQKPADVISKARATFMETPNNSQFATLIVGFFEQAQAVE